MYISEETKSFTLQLPEKTEPALADKEIIMAALNIKSMNFGSNFLVGNIEGDKGILESNRIPILLDLAFASNVRYLDETEMYMNNVELYTTLPYASGVAMARGILDSLMSATYFNASALRLLRQLVTGGASFELEKSLAEGAGLRGGYSTPETLVRSAVIIKEIIIIIFMILLMIMTILIIMITMIVMFSGCS